MKRVFALLGLASSVFLVATCIFAQARSSSSDEKIATEVIKRLKSEFDPGATKPFRIDVEVKGAVVWLSGYAAAEEQRARAVEIAQETPGVTKVSDSLTVKSEGASPDLLPFRATLLLVKSDWSKPETAISISEDLQKALKEEAVPGELRGKLPASATTILFPSETALLYKREHYLALRQWLKAKDLIMGSERFEVRLVAVGPEEQKHYDLTLTKDLDFFGLSLSSPAADQAFVSRKVALTWSIGKQLGAPSNKGKKGGERLSFSRVLTTSEKPRGQEEYVSRGVQDDCRFSLPLGDSDVLIVPAFPSKNDGTFQMAGNQRGVVPLLVIEFNVPQTDPTTEARFFLPDKVERLTVNKTQNASNSLWLTGGWSQPARYVISRDVMVSWSEGRDVAWGFSKLLGNWAKQEIQPAAGDTRGLTVDDDLAVWRVGSAYYGFSGKTGTWDLLRLPEGHSPPQILDGGFARVHDGDDLFTFSATTGRWSSPTGSSSATESTNPKRATANWDLELKKREVEGSYNAARENLAAIIQQLTIARGPDRSQLETEEAKLRPQVKSLGEQLELINQRLANPAVNPPAAPATPGLPGAAAAPIREANPVAVGADADETQIKVFALRNLRATDAERIITQLFVRDVRSIAADERTNSLIVRGPAAELNLIYPILTRLDEPAESGGASQSTTASGWSRAVTGASVENLTSQYQAKERQAADLARQIRERQTAPKEHESAIKDLSDKLRRAVTDAFAARQQLHQIEVAQLQQRISGIQQTLKTRDRLSKEIIDKRVKDLLNPDLQWEAADSNSRAARAEPNAWPAGSAPSSKTSTSSSERPKVTYGTWWGPESEQVFAALGLTLKKLTREDAADPKHVGAMKITAISPDSPAKELKAGDIIQSMMVTGTPPNITRATLQVIRGSEHFPVYVEFSSATSKSVPSAKLDAEAARAVRDKLLERWKQVEKLFEFGRASWMETLQATKDLNEAEVGAAASADERREALQAAVDRLKQIKSIVDAKFAEGAEPEHQKLAVDAEVLKAEAELAASKQQPNVSRRAAGEKAEWKADSRSSSDQPSATRTPPIDRRAAAKVRDVLRQRVELLNQTYKSGGIDYLEYLRAVVQLDDAEIAAGASADEQRKAMQTKIDHLKQIAERAQQGYRAGELNQADLLAYQAELLKAEAELASAGGTVTDPPAKSDSDAKPR